MADPFASPKRRLGRAKHHFDVLDRGITVFLKENQGVAVVEMDAEGKRELHKIRLANAPPSTLIDSAAETIEALRSALDQASYVCCYARHGPKRSGTHFPIGDTSDDVENALAKGQSKWVPKEIAPLFCSFHPYKGGNNVIWALNRLANHGKHRLLVPICATIRAIQITGDSMAGLGIPAIPVWDSGKNEILILSCDVGTKPNYNLNLSIRVGFGEIDELEGQPADGIIRLMIAETEQIIRATEAEAHRVGLI